jgi:hypothetical protein
MKLYVGNCQTEFNCDELVSQLQTQQVAPSHGHMELDPNNPLYDEYVHQTKMLSTAGYNEQVVEYRHYKCGEHFSRDIEISLGKIVGATPLMCWISEIRPGKCTPWHWDINPWEEEHKKLGELVRYFCFISAPQPGHIFVTEHDAYYNEPQGSIYQYDDIHTWHAGSNVGLVPKFLLTLTAYK